MEQYSAPDLLDVFPAWAGVDPKRTKEEIAMTSIPRVGGGRPHCLLRFGLAPPYSPRGRG